MRFLSMITLFESILSKYFLPLLSVKIKHLKFLGALISFRLTIIKSKILLYGTIISSVSGGGHFGGGMFINSLDHARFGLLFLRNGKWKNELLLSPEWIKLVQQPSENNESYGYMWWLNKGARKWDGLPENIYYGAGFGGNYVVIIPDSNLVIVARWIDSSKIGDFVKKIVDSQL